MPALSPTMEEGKLAKWLVKEGERIKSGKVIAEIETDKATMEVEAVDEGVLAKILVAEGTEKVLVNTPIAVLLMDGETGIPAAPPAAPPAKPAASAAPAAQAQAHAQPQAASALPATPAQAPPAPAAAAANDHAGGRLAASPLARRLAREAGIELSKLTGTGPHGRIVKRDIEAAARGLRAPSSSGAASPAAQPSTAMTPVSASVPQTAPAVAPMADDKILALYEQGSYDVIPHDGMRRVIAQRLTQSKSTVPHFYLTLDVRLDELLRARERINAAAPKTGPRAFKLSVNDFIIKGLALALQQVPAANASWTEGGMLRHRHSDVGVAVAVEGGLFTPVIRHAELKTLGEISNEMKDLAERARKRRLAPHEYQGGTTSISNLGMFGIKNFDAVINPPHATILAVGAGEKRPVVAANGQIEAATLMSCTLSCDHRVVDGALGAELLNAFKQYMEDPVRMLV
jgi:pyruvate dehydrogenase E2 component (dihydrolipoamide acetyltransferase)